MDEVDFSKDKTHLQQEDLLFDGVIPQIKIHNDFSFTKNNTVDVSHKVILTVDDCQEKATHNKTCRKADTAIILDKITENTVNKKHDQEKQRTVILHLPPNKESTSKSNISDILLNHLSKDEFITGQGIDCETFPEISNADSFDEPIIKNVVLCYVKNSRLKEQTPEFDDQLKPRKIAVSEDSSKPSCSPITTAEKISDLEEPVVAGCSSLEENSNFLTKMKGPSDKQKSSQGQAFQKQQSEKSSSWSGFKYGQGQVHYQLPDFSKVTPKVKIPKNNLINTPLTVFRPSRSLNLKDESALVQNLLEIMPRSNCVERQHQEQKRETVETSQQTQIEPTAHTVQELLTGIESKTSPYKLSSASQEDSSSSSYTFQNISKGKQMCQKLKEQTDQLKAKVQDFAKRITQDSPYLQRKLVLEKLQGHLELLEQEFLATKEKHLTLQQQGHKHKSPAVEDFDPERKVEGEIFKLEMLLEDFKEKVNEHKYISPASLPVDSAIILHDLVSVSSPPSNEIPKEDPGYPSVPPGACGSEGPEVTLAGPQEVSSKEIHELGPQTYLNWRSRNVAAQDLLDQMSICLSSVSKEDPSNTAGGQEHAETTVPSPAPSPSCAFCHRALERKQKMEKRSHRRISHGRFSVVIEENPLHLCSACSSDTGGSFYSDSSMRLQSHGCENCRAKISNSPAISRKELSRGCSKPKRICSQKADLKSPQGEHEPISEKKDLTAFVTYGSNTATPPARSHSRRIYGSKSVCDFRSVDKTEFEVLHSALDHALRTATILKETTDQMIKAISEDLAKARRQRNRLKY